MRAKRGALLFVLASSLLLFALFGVLGIPHSEPNTLAASPHGGAGLPSAPQLAGDAGSASSREGGPSDPATKVFWTAAALCAAVFFSCMVAFRGEVRKEKESIRARKQRMDYHKDLKRYNAQLRGPPRDNT